ncbi:MAG: RNA polymerase sigma factor [Sphingopyxis sp.]
MIDDAELNAWFCREVLPLERSLTQFIRRNLREPSDVVDARQEVYTRVLAGVRKELPMNAAAYVYTVARNHLINIAAHSKIVSIEFVAELEDAHIPVDLLAGERQLDARDELRRAFNALDALPPRCREVVRLRKVEGYSIREAASRMGVGVDTIERQLTLGMRAIADFMLGGTGRIDRKTPRGSRVGRAFEGDME